MCSFLGWGCKWLVQQRTNVRQRDISEDRNALAQITYKYQRKTLNQTEQKIQTEQKKIRSEQKKSDLSGDAALMPRSEAPFRLLKC